jgi:two-component system, chemotaxis family, protein-glutamate methylesterase/glutaminase
MAAAEPAKRPPARRAADLAAPQHHVDVVVMGASAGGLEALTRVLGALPPDFGAAVFVVLHIAATGSSALPAILGRASPLAVAEACEGAPIETGHVYVAPPNRHVELERGVVHVTRGPKENGHRPAIDPLFRTAARAYGPHVAGVILSGTLDDGTTGLYEVAQHGGVTLVQDPDTALYPGMPRSAVSRVDVDAILPLEQVGPALMRLADRSPRPGSEPAAPPVVPAVEDVRASRFGCPDCGGPLWEVDAGGITRFRCAIGHSYSTESLFSGQAHELELALWAAVRLLEDRAVLLRRMSETVGAGTRSAAGFERQAQVATERATLIRTALEQGAATPRLLDDEADGGVVPA